MRLTRPVRAIFGLEIRSLIRDPRTILVSVILPVVLLPLLLLAASWNEQRRVEREEGRTFRIAVTGPDSAFASGLVERILDPSSGAGGAVGRFRIVEAPDPRTALEEDLLDAYVEAFTPEQWRALDSRGTERVEIPRHMERSRVLRIRHLSTRGASRMAGEQLHSRLFELRSGRRDSILVAAGFSGSPRELVPVDTVNVASEQEVQGARLGRFLTLILMGLMLLGGSAVATDTLAGEKERGTLDTLLTSAASRDEIITGKLLAVVAVALTIALIQVLNLWIYLGLGLIDPGRGFGVEVSPALAVTLLAVYLPVVVLTAGVLLLTSAYARSYKEAQLYLTPVLLGMAVPTLAPLLPDVSLRSIIVLVPLANLSVGARDVLVGDVNGPALALAWLITAGVAAWVTTRSVRALHDEALVTGGTTREEFLGGPGLFRKRVFRWFLVFWAVKVMLDFNLTFADLRVTALVSVGIVFLAFPLLVIRWFQLDPVEALALRMPRPGAWIGVILGAPAALIAANFFFRLMDFVLPVPQQLLENLGQSLMPEGIPVWQLVLLLAVLPGIAEELTFRGILLHGLRRRFGPVGLALAVGLVFGFFHFQIFRIPVSALLGVILTVVTLLTGSIFPAIVWHAVNNGLAVVLATRGVDLTEASWWWGAWAVLGLAGAFWALWIFRTPYPDVGPRRRTTGRSAGAEDRRPGPNPGWEPG